MIFSDSPQQRALERMMTAVPRFRPKGGGIMVLHHFEYTAEMCDCRYAAQSSEINNKISALRSERKRKLAEDEGNEQLDKLKELQGILDEYEPTKAFDEDLFHQIIEKAVVMSKSEIAFHLIGGLKLTETIA